MATEPRRPCVNLRRVHVHKQSRANRVRSTRWPFPRTHIHKPPPNRSLAAKTLAILLLAAFALSGDQEPVQRTASRVSALETIVARATENRASTPLRRKRSKNDKKKVERYSKSCCRASVVVDEGKLCGRQSSAPTSWSDKRQTLANVLRKWRGPYKCIVTIGIAESQVGTADQLLKCLQSPCPRAQARA
ncbi:hypothetical protein BD413DRAFT_200095 [Trametes elegans]|nr:hypothetical protein BD413DRAFT_200095 [Trametes elegans]